ncbi:hypothetical protein ABG768_018921 [Culter alburnus]|uniref:CxC7-like cysteine cluster associated with KDZ transposases domain-containing protein n=1 Tax=Culter alburnus TaxID=194366 RepID=A0AAW2AYE7_CULAL
MALNWKFDFTQHDMSHIRRWWVNLILSKMTHGRKKRCTSAMLEAFKEEKRVTKWRTKSEPFQEFYKMYTLQPCRHCNEVYKNCLPGYVGRGKRGEMQGFYSENTHPGFCSDWCMMLEEE